MQDEVGIGRIGKEAQPDRPELLQVVAGERGCDVGAALEEVLAVLGGEFDEAQIGHSGPGIECVPERTLEAVGPGTAGPLDDLVAHQIEVEVERVGQDVRRGEAPGAALDQGVLQRVAGETDGIADRGCHVKPPCACLRGPALCAGLFQLCHARPAPTHNDQRQIAYA